MVGVLRIIAAVVGVALALQTVVPCVPSLSLPSEEAQADAPPVMSAPCTCPFHTARPSHPLTGLEHPVIFAEGPDRLPDQAGRAWPLASDPTAPPDGFALQVEPPPRASSSFV